jgi:hypothetical protein
MDSLKLSDVTITQEIINYLLIVGQHATKVAISISNSNARKYKKPITMLVAFFRV